MIPYGRQDVTSEDIEAVIKVLQSDWLTQGPMVPAFEDSVSQYCAAKYAVATNSATSALHIACLALGLGPDDWLWTTTNTFVASSNCALYCGAQVDFVDIEPDTYNISISALEKKLSRAEAEKKLPKIIVPVHFAGQSCDMAAIHELSKKYHFHIIEDASHAIGGRYKDTPIGRCQYSDITVFSFHPVKIITSGEGGVATSNNADLAEKMRRLRSHGITKNTEDMTKSSEGPWYYQQIELGFNYRMTDIHAALGNSQMQRLDQYVEQRHELVHNYNKLLSGMVVTPKQNKDCYPSWHLYVVRLPTDNCKYDKKKLFEHMHKLGINVNLHYIPVYRQPYYSSMGFNVSDYPESERYYTEAMTLPLYPGLTTVQQEKVVECLSMAMEKSQA